MKFFKRFAITSKKPPSPLVSPITKYDRERAIELFLEDLQKMMIESLCGDCRLKLFKWVWNYEIK